MAPNTVILTKREREARELVCRGFSSKEMARQMGISSRTVEDYRWQLLLKYKVRNVVELVAAVYGIDHTTAKKKEPG